MRDRRTKRGLLPRTLDIDVDPLLVAGAGGESVDERLIDQ